MKQALRLVVIVLILVSGFLGSSVSFSLIRNLSSAFDEVSREPILLSIVVVTLTFVPAFLLNLKLLRRRVSVDDDILDDSQKNLRAPDLQMPIPRWMNITNLIYSMAVAAFIILFIFETYREVGFDDDDFIIWILVIAAASLTFLMTFVSSFPSLVGRSASQNERLPEEF